MIIRFLSGTQFQHDLTNVRIQNVNRDFAKQTSTGTLYRSVTLEKLVAMLASLFGKLGRPGMTALLFLLALAPVAQGERLPIKTYATADGLAGNQVNKIIRDSRGFLWFCTGDGLSRFDGYAFTNF